MDPQSSASHESLASESAADRPQPPRKRRHRWIWVVVLLLFGLLFYWVLHHQQKSEAATGGGRRGMVGGIVPVTTATAHSGSVGIYLEAIGTVTPLHTASITSQVTGVIMAVHYREGQIVRQGDPLIEIDPRQFQAQLDQAQGTLERDQNFLEEARMDLERYKQAWSKNAIPRQTLEDQEKVVLQDQGTVKNDEGTVKFDQVQLSYAHITAPFSGRVGLRLSDPGNLVTANSTTTLLVLTQEQPITVVFTVPEDNLPQVLQQTRGKKALRVDAFDRTQEGHLASGKLTSIDNQIDTTTGTVKMRAEFDNREHALFPNQFVNTRLLVKTLDNQVLIPSSAIQHNGTQDFVYLIQKDEKGEKAVQHPVKSGVSDHGETAVQGIKPGDDVADSSFEKLQNGSQITRSKMQLPSNSENPASAAP
ncbi:MAG TPA: efflux RND transporter periplasmic adaptor subunit [Terracidiphilus sp.]|jgi:multidrug efflux system membrane fusion protein|nr:efflux RND transporter periplasmic adaptor subunit [Terracidiphilus sp.]